MLARRRHADRPRRWLRAGRHPLGRTRQLTRVRSGQSPRRMSMTFSQQSHTQEALMDRYTKIVLTVIAVALVVIAARPLLPSMLEGITPDAALAQAPPVPKYEVNVPKSWGKFIAISNNNLVLESAEGWRIVDVEGKMPEYPKVKVLIHWQ